MRCSPSGLSAADTTMFVSTTSRSEIICALFLVTHSLDYTGNLLRIESVRALRRGFIADKRQNLGLWGCEPHIVPNTEHTARAVPRFSIISE